MRTSAVKPRMAMSPEATILSAFRLQTIVPYGFNEMLIPPLTVG